MNNKLFIDIFNELLKPISLVLIISLAGLGWALAIQLMREVIELRTKLGKETEQEVFKEWFLRKSAPFVFHLYSLKTFIMDIQFNLILKQLLRKRKKVWRLIFQLD